MDNLTPLESYKQNRTSAKDLVGQLLSHGARAWRNTQPRCHVQVNTGVRINLGPLFEGSDPL